MRHSTQVASGSDTEKHLEGVRSVYHLGRTTAATPSAEDLEKGIGPAYPREIGKGIHDNPIMETETGVGLCTGEIMKGFGHMSNRDFAAYRILFGKTSGVIRSLGNAEEATRPPDTSGVGDVLKRNGLTPSLRGGPCPPARQGRCGWKGRLRRFR